MTNFKNSIECHICGTRTPLEMDSNNKILPCSNCRDAIYEAAHEDDPLEISPQIDELIEIITTPDIDDFSNTDKPRV